MLPQISPVLFAVVLLGACAAVAPVANANFAGSSTACNVEQISARLIQHETVGISFTQHTHIKVLINPLVSTGVVYVDRNLGVVWQVQQPLQSNLIVNEQGINLGSGLMDSSRVMGNLLREILAGDLRQLTQSFSAQNCHIPTTGEPSGQWSLKLVPHSAHLAQRLASLHFTGTDWITQLHMMQANGNRIDVAFDRPQELSQLPTDIVPLLTPNP